MRDNLIGEGQAASAGAATGLVTFSSGEATKLNSEGKECILCREETSADDIAGMKVLHFNYTNYIRLSRFNDRLPLEFSL